MPSKILITTFYKFSSQKAQSLKHLHQVLLNQATQSHIRGLLLISEEGCNGTLSGSPKAISQFKEFMVPYFGSLTFKDSWSAQHPFFNMKVKIKKEIIALNHPELVPRHKDFHLSPRQWHEVLKEDNVIILDMRNRYETSIGHFHNAIDPQLNEFNEFPKYLKNSQLPKDKKILMYCTGGVRCEKGALLAQEAGYHQVYQLDGGILNYLKEFPNEQFQGECFVFDYRVAVDQHLKPSRKYRLCPHCGEPGKSKITCQQCGQEDIVCQNCLYQSLHLETCSKNCAHHFKLGHTTRNLHSDGHRKRILVE